MPAKMSKKAQQVTTMIDTLRKSDEAIPFFELCQQVGNKYPQDLLAAMHALEHVGFVARGEGSIATYKWVSQDQEAKPKRARTRKSTPTETRDAAGA